MPKVQTYNRITEHIFPDEATYIKAMERGEIEEGDRVYIQDSETSDLPNVTEEDDGKVLQVENGEWVAKKLPVYDEKYSVTPSAESQTLSTAGKTMIDDLTVEEIPYYEVSNEEGGTTINIG